MPMEGQLTEEACWDILLQFREMHRRADKIGMQRLHSQLAQLFCRRRPLPVQRTSGPLPDTKPAPPPPPFPDLPPCARGQDVLYPVVKPEQLISCKKGKEEDEESVGCATEAEPEGDDATEVDATTECGEETVLGTLTMGSDRESIAAQTMKVAAVEDEMKSSLASGSASARSTQVGDGSTNPRRQRRRASKTGARPWRPTLSLESAAMRGQDDGSTWRLPTPPGRQPPGLLPPRAATTRKRTKSKRSEGKKDGVDSEKPTLAATTRGGSAKAPEAAASRSGQDGANTHARPPPAARGAERVHPRGAAAQPAEPTEPTASWTYAYLFGDAEEPSPYVRS